MKTFQLKRAVERYQAALRLKFLEPKSDLLKDVQYRERQVEELRIEYAVQLVQTNKSQAEYYECDLPAALDNLQKICEGQCLYFASVMTRYASTVKAQSIQ